MPLARYDAEVRRGNLRADEEQRAVVQKLDLIAEDLRSRKNWVVPSRSLFARWKNPVDSHVRGITGLYLWGGVGRGKTHLCDLFFETVLLQNKKRMHFHHFMQQIHDDLRKLEGVKDPMHRIADEWASNARLLLLDEIHVNDITDAMLLGGLLSELFTRGVTLVTTSNVPPEGLYKEGLQRARFLPAIAQICNHTDVVEMVGVTDYRLRLLQKEPIYLVGSFTDGVADAKTQLAMRSMFDKLHSNVGNRSTSIVINSREIPVVRHTSDMAWFTFEALCDTDRSTQDYIHLAGLYKTILISDIPVMDDTTNNAARRFVNMIDEFYDRHVKLIVSAEAEANKLYSGKRLAFEFERAASRLFEMQTTEYLAAQHSM